MDPEVKTARVYEKGYSLCLFLDRRAKVLRESANDAPREKVRESEKTRSVDGRLE